MEKFVIEYAAGNRSPELLKTIFAKLDLSFLKDNCSPQRFGELVETFVCEFYYIQANSKLYDKMFQPIEIITGSSGKDIVDGRILTKVSDDKYELLIISSKMHNVGETGLSFTDSDINNCIIEGKRIIDNYLNTINVILKIGLVSYTGLSYEGKKELVKHIPSENFVDIQYQAIQSIYYKLRNYYNKINWIVGKDKKEIILPRYHQQWCINKYVKRMMADPSYSLLLAHTCRSGKTITAYMLVDEYMRRTNTIQLNISIITGMPSLFEEWIDGAHKVFDNNKLNIIIVKDSYVRTVFAKDKLNIVLCSTQMLVPTTDEYGNVIEKQKVINIMHATKFDFTITDEAHTHIFAAKTQTNLGKILYDKLISCSATPFRDEFYSKKYYKDIDEFSYFDKEKHKKDLHSDYIDDPSAIWFHVQPQLTKEVLQEWLDSGLWDMNSGPNLKLLFDGNHEKDCIKLFTYIEECIYNGVKLNSDENRSLHDGMWKVSDIPSANYLYNLLIKMQKLGQFEEFNFKIFTSEEDYCNLYKSACSHFATNKVQHDIAIVVRQLTTGHTFNTVDHILFLDETKSATQYIQAMHRGGSKCKYDKDNFVKDFYYVFDFSQYRLITIRDTFAKEYAKRGKLDGNVEKQLIDAMLPIYRKSQNECYKLDIEEVEKLTLRYIYYGMLSSLTSVALELYSGSTVFGKNTISFDVKSIVDIQRKNKEINLINKEFIDFGLQKARIHINRGTQSVIQNGSVNTLEEVEMISPDYETTEVEDVPEAVPIFEQEVREEITEEELIARDEVKFLVNVLFAIPPTLAYCKLDNPSLVVNSLEALLRNANPDVLDVYLSNVKKDFVKLNKAFTIDELLELTKKCIIADNIDNTSELDIRIYSMNNGIDELLMKDDISRIINTYIYSDLYKKEFAEVFTPQSVVDEQLDLLPKEVWNNPELDWLDPTSGSGTYVISIYDRLMIGLSDIIKSEKEKKLFILKNMIHFGDIQGKNNILTKVKIRERIKTRQSKHISEYSLLLLDLFDSLKLTIFFDNYIKELSVGRFTTIQSFLTGFYCVHDYLVNIGDLDLMITNIKKYLEDIKQYIVGYEKISDRDKKLFGEVFTPQPLVEEMLDLYPKHIWNDETLKWLDPCCGVGNFEVAVIERYMDGLKEKFPDDWQRFEHILKNMIYFADISIKNIFILYGLFEESDIQLNVYRGDFLDSKFDKHMKEVWNVDKFDVIVGNPPYNDKLDLKFLTKYHYISNQFICIVHPGSYLLDKKMKYKTYNDMRKMLKNSLQRVIMFNGAKAFGVRFGAPTAIVLINKNKESSQIEVECRINNSIETYDNIFDINTFNCDSMFKSIKSKIILHLTDNIEKHKNILIGPYYIDLPIIRSGDDSKIGFTYSKEFYTFCSKKTNVKYGTDHPQSRSLSYISFISELEAINFFTYIKGKFARMCLGLLKSNQDLGLGQLELVPYLDFTQEWTDERLYKEFDLSQEEIDFINKHIEPYY